MTECLKICTFNVNGLGDKVKRKAIFQNIRTRKIDICLLQKTHSIYAPTQDKEHGQLIVLSQLKEQLMAYSDELMLLGGDFNIALDPGKDRRGNHTQINSRRYRRALKETLETLDLVDYWREINPNSRRYTFHRKNQASRLDYWFTSNFFKNKIKKCTIDIGTHSDHSPVILRVNTDISRGGPGSWKLNNNLLQDNEYVQAIKDLLAEIKSEETGLDDSSHWDYIKYRIKTCSISFSRDKANKEKHQINELRKRLRELIEHHDNQTDQTLEISSIKKEIEFLQNKKAQATIFRSKCNWSQHSEKPTKYFLNLEKKNYSNKLISHLKQADGTITNDSLKILQIMENYYKDLYREDETDSLLAEPNVFITDDMPKLTNYEKDCLEAGISEGELFYALKCLRNNKCPGSDGFSVEFYKTFWEDIKQLLHKSLLLSNEVGYLSTEQRRGIISLIPKKEADRQTLNNWRPITLLNVDYKILTKALALRLKRQISNLIFTDQTGYVAGRYIGTNVRTIEDIIEYTDKTKEPGYLLALDFQKAFDSVSWSSIPEALKLYGFGHYIRWVQIIYRDSETCISNNGYNSKWFNPKRGTRQGCCLSPFLFVLVLELLAIATRNEQNIRGIHIGSKEINLTIQADDLTLFLKDPQSIDYVLDFLESFRRYTGLKINKEKSHILPLGRNLGKPMNDIPFQGCDKVTILGIIFSSNRSEEQHYEWNYKSRLEKCKNICEDWRNRTLSIKGKVTVVNSLVTSIMLYPTTNTTVPDRVYVEFRKIINKFIWGSSVNRVAYQTLCLNIEKGGLKLLDLGSMVKAAHIKWVKRLYMSDQERWTMFPRYTYNVNLSLYHIFFAKKKKSFKHTSSLFYRDILASWLEIYYREPLSEEERQNENIWNNDYIKVGEAPYWKVWEKAGVVHVYDIISNNTIMFIEQMENTYDIKCNFLQLLQMRSAIPWKKHMTMESLDIDPMCLFIQNAEGEAKNVFHLSSKTIYNIIMETSCKTPTAQLSWGKLYPKLTPNSEIWERIYLTSFKCTRESKLQSLQYKVYHRIVPCNRYLFKRKGVDSPECTFCGMEDNILHFFLYCPNVAFFWITLKKWLKNVLALSIVDEIEEGLIFNNPNNNKEAKIENFILLTVKFYIYRQRLFH